MGTFKNFFPTYQKRKAVGHAWPGFIEDVRSCAPERACDLPQFMHLLDEDVLAQCLNRAGFVIEHLGFNSALEEYPQDMKLDGREQIGAIALKQ